MDMKREVLLMPQHNVCEPSGCWSVFQHGTDGTPEMIEGDLPEEIARQMVADYAAEGETVWLERTVPAPE